MRPSPWERENRSAFTANRRDSPGRNEALSLGEGKRDERKWSEALTPSRNEALSLGEGKPRARLGRPPSPDTAAMRPSPWERENLPVEPIPVRGRGAAMRPSPWERENEVQARREALGLSAAMRPSPWERENLPRPRRAGRRLGAAMRPSPWERENLVSESRYVIPESSQPQ